MLGWTVRTLTHLVQMRICAVVLIGLSLAVLAACDQTDPAPKLEATPALQSAPLIPQAVAPVAIPSSVPTKTPTLSPGAASAAQQRDAFPLQEQIRAAEAERAAQIRRDEAEQERREAILREIARRAEQTHASILEEQYRLAARQEIVSSACEQAQIAEIAADLPRRTTGPFNPAV